MKNKISQRLLFALLCATQFSANTCGMENEQIQLLPEIQEKIVITIVDLYLDELEDIIENFDKNIRPGLKWGMGPFSSFSYKKSNNKLLDKIMYWLEYICFKPVRATIHLNNKTKAGNTLLHHATKAACNDCFALCNIEGLLEHGANPNEKDNNGRTAFWYCMANLPLESLSYNFLASEKKENLVSLFLKNKANPSSSSDDNDFMWVLAGKECSNLVEQIIACCSDIKAYINVKRQDNTPAYEAASMFNLKFLHILANNGADFNITNYKGKTPLECAEEMRRILSSCERRDAVINFLQNMTHTNNQ